MPLGLSNVVGIAAGGFDNFAVVNDGSPIVLWQPETQTRFSGTTAIFSSRAVYSRRSPTNGAWMEWIFPVQPVSMLTVANVQPTNGGSYSVRVASSFGSDTSSNAMLMVVVSGPSIVGQPTNQIVALGSNTTLTATAVGSLPLSFQWLFNGTNIAGATNPSLDLTNTQPSEEGSYALMVTNAYGTAVSSNAFLSVLDLAGALGTTNLVWTTFGNAPWFVEGTNTYDGLGAAQSGSDTSIASSPRWRQLSSDRAH